MDAALTGRRRWAQAARCPDCRSIRISVLLVAVVLLSLGDLYMTLLHLQSFGLLEANPVARSVMGMGSPAFVAVWKVASVMAAVGILFRLRRRGAAEVGALLCVAILTWLTLRWGVYNESVRSVSYEHLVVATKDPRFVTMVPGG